MARHKSIPDSVFENAERDFQRLKGGKIAGKLMAILAYKEETSETVSRIFRMSQRHFLKLVHDYQKYGIEALINQPRGHNASKLNEEQLSEIKLWMVERKTKDKLHIHWTLSKLQQAIKSNYNIDISTVAIWNHLHSLGLVVKVPRPKHHKGDKVKQEDFKKKLNT